MIRRSDAGFLKTISVSSAGDHSSIKTTMHCLSESTIQVAAVLDGDQTAIPRENNIQIARCNHPGKEVFAEPKIQDYLRQQYGLFWPDYYAGNILQNVDHHQWIPRLAADLCTDKESLTRELARIYAATQDCATFTKLLKEAIST